MAESFPDMVAVATDLPKKAGMTIPDSQDSCLQLSPFGELCLDKCLTLVSVALKSGIGFVFVLPTDAVVPPGETLPEPLQAAVQP